MKNHGETFQEHLEKLNAEIRARMERGAYIVKPKQGTGIQCSLCGYLRTSVDSSCEEVLRAALNGMKRPH